MFLGEGKNTIYFVEEILTLSPLTIINRNNVLLASSQGERSNREIKRGCCREAGRNIEVSEQRPAKGHCLKIQDNLKLRSFSKPARIGTSSEHLGTMVGKWVSLSQSITNDYNLFSADHYMALLITHQFTDQDFFWDFSPIFGLTHSPCKQKDPLKISHAVRVFVPFLTLFLSL